MEAVRLEDWISTSGRFVPYKGSEEGLDISEEGRRVCVKRSSNWYVHLSPSIPWGGKYCVQVRCESEIHGINSIGVAEVPLRSSGNVSTTTFLKRSDFSGTLEGRKLKEGTSFTLFIDSTETEFEDAIFLTIDFDGIAVLNKTKVPVKKERKTECVDIAMYLYSAKDEFSIIGNISLVQLSKEWLMKT